MRKLLLHSSSLLFTGYLLAESADARTNLLKSAGPHTGYSEQHISMDAASEQRLPAASWLLAAIAEPTACGIVSAADAQKLVGAPLDVQELPKLAAASGAGSYDSVCTYISKGGDFENPVSAGRFLDVTLHFLNSIEEMKSAYEGSLEQYRQMAKAPDAPFKNAVITPLSGFGDKAFVVEAVTDPKTSYKSALIVFYKGRVGGTVSAWKKPESSLETTKTALRHILSKLP